MFCVLVILLTLLALSGTDGATPAITRAAGHQQQRPRPFVYPGEEVPEDTIRVTTLGSGSPDVRRHQARMRVDRQEAGGGCYRRWHGAAI